MQKGAIPPSRSLLRMLGRKNSFSLHEAASLCSIVQTILQAPHSSATTRQIWEKPILRQGCKNARMLVPRLLRVVLMLLALVGLRMIMR